MDIDGRNPESLKVREYKMCFDRFLAGHRTDYNRRGYENYLEYLGRCDLDWVYDDKNFEDLQRGLMRYYTENGTF